MKTFLPTLFSMAYLYISYHTIFSGRCQALISFFLKKFLYSYREASKNELAGQALSYQTKDTKYFVNL